MWLAQYEALTNLLNGQGVDLRHLFTLSYLRFLKKLDFSRDDRQEWEHLVQARVGLYIQWEVAFFGVS